MRAKIIKNIALTLVGVGIMTTITPCHSMINKCKAILQAASCLLPTFSGTQSFITSNLTTLRNNPVIQKNGKSALLTLAGFGVGIATEKSLARRRLSYPFEIEEKQGRLGQQIADLYLYIITPEERKLIGNAKYTYDASIQEVYLDYIMITPEYQRKGFGSILIKHILRTTDCKSLAGDSISSAVDFYKKLGGAVPDPERPGENAYYKMLNSTQEQALFMSNCPFLNDIPQPSSTIKLISKPDRSTPKPNTIKKKHGTLLIEEVIVNELTPTESKLLYNKSVVQGKTIIRARMLTNRGIETVALATYAAHPNLGEITLEHIVVDPQYQNEGIGTTLINHIIHTTDCTELNGSIYSLLGSDCFFKKLGAKLKNSRLYKNFNNTTQLKAFMNHCPFLGDMQPLWGPATPLIEASEKNKTSITHKDNGVMTLTVEEAARNMHNRINALPTERVTHTREHISSRPIEQIQPYRITTNHNGHQIAMPIQTAITQENCLITRDEVNLLAMIDMTNRTHPYYNRLRTTRGGPTSSNR